jgi:hypothetical protein
VIETEELAEDHVGEIGSLSHLQDAHDDRLLEIS